MMMFLNGKFVAEEEARISALSMGLLQGAGLFETMRSYRGRIVYFAEHLQRIKGAATYFGLRLPYSLARLKGLLGQAVKINALDDAFLRLTLWEEGQETGISIIARRYQPYPVAKYKKGFSAGIAQFKNGASFLLRFKTTSRSLYELSLRQARAQGFDEAILLNSRGYLCEGTRSNLFLAKGNVLLTAALDCGCLEGITRKWALDLAQKSKIEFYVGNLTPYDLLRADEAFLTNSLIGVMPLVRLQDQKIATGRPGKLTRFFMREYKSVLRNGC